MAKTYTCRVCDQGGFKAAWEIKKHRLEAHPDLPKPHQKRQRERREDLEDSGEEETTETDVLVNCAGWFEQGKLSHAAARRVLLYLADRFTPETVCLIHDGENAPPVAEEPTA